MDETSSAQLCPLYRKRKYVSAAATKNHTTDNTVQDTAKGQIS
eukprot:CAMPEP_0198568564 /NCGR_PEP_ID=MMETSP1462-20131121/106612_1 /TAXON_ID=1333877 /ORGANISM="Brandtodinium nutriculum, Strain RCC3387" /LENGTH=42 /DNA_ID= /DNA_START= /DNA_END= /DNA_ORIENTATION=